MRRIAIAFGLILLLAAGSAVAVAWYRPELVPPWVRHLRIAQASAESAAEEESTSSLDESAPDDSWRQHLGKLAPADCKRSLPTVILASDETASQIGIETARIETRPLFPTVAGNAEISFVTHDYAHVTSRVSGRVSAVPADEGDTVKQGDVLVLVDSAEVGSAKAQYLSVLSVVDYNRKEHRRISGLRGSGAASEKEEMMILATLTKAEAELLNARQLLLNMGFSDKEIAHIAETKDTSRDLKITAPMGGRLVERHAVPGEAVIPPSNIVNSGGMQSLFEIADLSEMWCWIDVSETDIDKVTIGQDVRFTISSTETPVFSGHVQLISFAVNTTTRTVRVRASLKNIGERLRANQYGRAIIRVGADRAVPVVPRSAVQSDHGVEFVFLKQSDPRRFRTQRIATRPTERSDEVEVTFGLKPGDVVVTSGSFLLKSELFKESLGED